MKTTTPLFERSRKQLLIYSITSLHAFCVPFILTGFAILFLASCDKNPVSDDNTQKQSSSAWFPTASTQWEYSGKFAHQLTTGDSMVHIALQDNGFHQPGSPYFGDAFTVAPENYITLTDTIIINFSHTFKQNSISSSISFGISMDSGKTFIELTDGVSGTIKLPPYTIYTPNPFLIKFYGSENRSDSTTYLTISNLTIRKK